MAAITFPTSSSPGESVQENGGRLINVYAEKLGDGARNPTKLARVPGLRPLIDVEDQSHIRGFLYVGSTLITVFDDRAVKVEGSTTFVETDLGLLAGTGPVTIARNNRVPIPDIVAVTENGAFNLFTGSPPTDFADSDLPQPNSVAIFAGYFVFTTSDGEIWATDLNSVNVNSLSSTQAQGRPDGLLRGISFRNEFFAMGPSSIEVYNNAGTAPFPLGFETMIPRGLIGASAVAGWEEGWSNELIWSGDDAVVYQLDGYTPDRISTHDQERMIEAVADKSTLEASVYMHGGHAIWALSSPDWTWCYDLVTKQWHERASYGQTRWRASQSVKAFGRWVTGDLETGKIFTIDPKYRKEDSDPLIFEAWSIQLSGFPARLQIPRMDFDFVMGTGIATGEQPIETDPSVRISWTDDGGYTWSTPVLRPLGAQGKARNRVTVLRGGQTGPVGRQVKLQISDPVNAVLLSAAMPVNAQGA